MLKVLITPSSAPAAQDQSAYSSICAPTSLLTFRVCTKQVLHLLYSQQKGGGVEVSEASRLFHKHDKTRIKNKFLPAQSLHYNFCSAVIRNSPVLASFRFFAFSTLVTEDFLRRLENYSGLLHSLLLHRHLPPYGRMHQPNNLWIKLLSFWGSNRTYKKAGNMYHRKVQRKTPL